MCSALQHLQNMLRGIRHIPLWACTRLSDVEETRSGCEKDLPLLIVFPPCSITRISPDTSGVNKDRPMESSQMLLLGSDSF